MFKNNYLLKIQLKVIIQILRICKPLIINKKLKEFS